MYLTNNRLSEIVSLYLKKKRVQYIIIVIIYNKEYYFSYVLDEYPQLFPAHGRLRFRAAVWGD
jgi:hypothetical protein